MNGYINFFLRPLQIDRLVGFLHVAPSVAWKLQVALSIWIFVPLVVYGAFEIGLIRAGPIWLWLLSIVRPRVIYTGDAKPRAAGNPLVSVVVPALNEEDTIARSLNSLLRCGYDNLEIIVVSDGSNDNTVPIARRVSAQVGVHPRTKRRKIRVYEAPRRSGRPSTLNIGMSQAEGEYVVVMDADSELQYGSIQRWLKVFEDPKIAGAAASVRVANAKESLVTRLQEVEFSTMMVLYPMVTSRLRLMSIVPGQGGMFRRSALQRIGFYDTGLGDDTDLSLRLLKTGSRITHCIDAVVWTHVPATVAGLLKQRRRWTKNRVRIRVAKHRDMLTFRYGLFNTLVAFRNLIRCQEPAYLLLIVLFAFALDPFMHPLWIPAIVTGFYLFSVLRFAIKIMISRDLAGTPSRDGWLVVALMPFYSFFLRMVVNFEIVNEGLKLQPYHAYVPPHIWAEAPRW